MWCVCMHVVCVRVVCVCMWCVCTCGSYVCVRVVCQFGVGVPEFSDLDPKSQTVLQNLSQNKVLQNEISLNFCQILLTYNIK